MWNVRPANPQMEPTRLPVYEIMSLRRAAHLERWADEDMGTWWIDEPALMGSSNLTDADLEQLRLSGFSVIVCLLDPLEQATGYDPRRAAAAGWEWHNIAIRDFNAPSVAQIRQFVALVAWSLPQKKTIVHCQGGTGRTGTMAAAYWIAKGLSVVQAIAAVRQRRPHAIETPEQEAVLVQFANSLTSADPPTG